MGRFETPDKNYVLEGVFKSETTVKDLKNQLVGVLPEKYSLFIIPPKQILKDTDVLFDLGFYTRGKIFVSCDENFVFSDQIITNLLKSLPVEIVQERPSKRIYESSSSRTKETST